MIILANSIFLLFLKYNLPPIAPQITRNDIKLTIKESVSININKFKKNEKLLSITSQKSSKLAPKSPQNIKEKKSG